MDNLTECRRCEYIELCKYREEYINLFKEPEATYPEHTEYKSSLRCKHFRSAYVMESTDGT